MGTGKPRISLAVRGLEIVLAVAPALGIGPAVAEVALQVAVELGIVPEAEELELGTARVLGRELPIAQVVGQELERVPVTAVLAQGHPRGRLAVALRTKSVIGAHRRGLPRLTAEDLAAVVETTREPAATEAVIAWEAAE